MSTLVRIESSGRVIDATERFAAGRPIAAARRVEMLSRWIAKAGAKLDEALRGVKDSIAVIERVPESAPESPILLSATTLGWLDAAARLDRLSLRLVELSGRLVAETDSRTAALDLRREASIPRYSHRSSLPIVRHPRPVVTTVADAARKISRGRAPPSFRPAISHRCNRNR